MSHYMIVGGRPEFGFISIRIKKKKRYNATVKKVSINIDFKNVSGEKNFSLRY